MVGGSLRVLWLLPPLKLVSMIYNNNTRHHSKNIGTILIIKYYAWIY
jgi:hypothetical protein